VDLPADQPQLRGDPGRVGQVSIGIRPDDGREPLDLAGLGAGPAVTPRVGACLVEGRVPRPERRGGRAGAVEAARWLSAPGVGKGPLPT
jgi:hypothetical protein